MNTLIQMILFYKIVFCTILYYTGLACLSQCLVVHKNVCVPASLPAHPLGLGFWVYSLPLALCAGSGLPY